MLLENSKKYRKGYKTETEKDVIEAFGILSNALENEGLLYLFREPKNRIMDIVNEFFPNLPYSKQVSFAKRVIKSVFGEL